MHSAGIFWSKAPFVRLLAALVTGIVVQWQWPLPVLFWAALFALLLAALCLYNLAGVGRRFRWYSALGLCIHLAVAAMGALLVWRHDVRNAPDWIGHLETAQQQWLLKLEEPLVVKTRSLKALASVVAVHNGKDWRRARGKLILYFAKDSLPNSLSNGSVLLTKRPLQAIRNAGNPGGFDYQRYSLFQGVTHQIFLKRTDYRQAAAIQSGGLKPFIYRCRQWVIATLQRYIAGRKEQGLAEALLIGYKDDLDKTLVQAYTNTGVVHVIAISGLHLGLIYWLLLALTQPLRKNKSGRFPALLLVITGLWLFSILAGGQPSVVRSAVMFSFMALGEYFDRKTTTLNTLALSAFCLLCYQPFWLWDVGFQLSYAAVLSIVLFFQPVYNWLYFANKSLDFLWRLNAVTIAAQLLTLPLSIYHFHQVPTLFLLTNLVAVPLSSLVLMGEILLCAISWLPPVAAALGTLLHRAIGWMNAYIERLDGVSFAVWNGLSINLGQLFLLLCVVLAFCFWLLHHYRLLFWLAAASLLAFAALRSLSFIQSRQQQKLIVYNVPRFQAVDILQGRQCRFVGDEALVRDAFVRNFHVQPSRILHRVQNIGNSTMATKFFRLRQKLVAIIDSTPAFVRSRPKPLLDLVVLSKNPKLTVAQLTAAYACRQIVIDGSVPRWKAARWKKDCDSLGIACHDVSSNGAFVLEQ